MKWLRIYIGSNNKTKKIEIKKIREIFKEYFNGWTEIKGKGYWKGEIEHSLIIEILAVMDIENILRIGKKLREKLKQEAILIMVNGKDLYIIGQESIVKEKIGDDRNE